MPPGLPVLGPAVTIEPVCGVVTVVTAYAVGPATRPRPPADGHRGREARQTVGQEREECRGETHDQDAPAQPPTVGRGSAQQPEAHPGGGPRGGRQDARPAQ